jgi:hypothetical protein
MLYNKMNYLYYLLIITCIFVITFFSTKIELEYPEILHEISEEPLYKFLALSIIIYTSQYDFSIALLLSIILIFTITDISVLSEINEKFTNGPPVNTCDIYNPKQTDYLGTSFYPLNDNNKIKKNRGEKGNPYNHEISY